jgi:hypothetical protein
LEERDRKKFKSEEGIVRSKESAGTWARVPAE